MMKIEIVICGRCFSVFATEAPFKDRTTCMCPICATHQDCYKLRLVFISNTGESYFEISKDTED